ncbi:MAG: DUF892 family protein [Methylobacterium sp.]|nr:DUF892 family protein [Methylobacterium sp.]
MLKGATLVAQDQRMAHHGLPGFGTAAGRAKAFGKSDDEAKLEQSMCEISRADEFASQVAA